MRTKNLCRTLSVWPKRNRVMRKSRRSKTIAGYRRRAARRSGRAKLYSVSEWKSIARVHRHHFGRRPKKRSYRKNCGMCTGRNPDRRMWTFMGYDVFPADRNSSGIRWYSRSGRGYYLKSDTKNGMKQLIREERGNTRHEGNPMSAESKKFLRAIRGNSNVGVIALGEAAKSGHKFSKKEINRIRGKYGDTVISWMKWRSMRDDLSK